MSSVTDRFNVITKIVENKNIGTVLSGEDEKIIRAYFKDFYIPRQKLDIKFEDNEIDCFKIDMNYKYGTIGIHVVHYNGKQLPCGKRNLAGAEK